METNTGSFIGIDVSKRSLDVSLGKEGEHFTVGNDEEGIARLVERLKGVEVALIVLESTGGLERRVLVALYAEQLPVALVNPGRVREFAKSTGRLAKTDKLDARILAHFAEAVRPPVVILPSEEEQELSALMTRRRQVLEMLTSEKNHLSSAPLSVRPFVERNLASLQQQLDELNQRINEFIDHNPTFHQKEDILRSAPGVGQITAAILLSDLPEIGHFNRKKIAALVGVAPFNDDSGRRSGKRRIKGGRESVRHVLYMATLASTRFNSVIRPFYQHLLQLGKTHKVALVACMRKFLTMLNAMIRDLRPWQPNFNY